MRIYCSLIYLLLHVFQNADTSCVLPSDLTGAWYSSSKGLLTISSNSTDTNIPSYPTRLFGTVSLTCEVSSGNYYVFKSGTFQYHRLDFELFVCFNLAEQVSSAKYVYYLGSIENSDASDERLKAYLVTSNTAATVNSVCDRTSYAAGTEHIFLKNDGSESNSKISCPFVFRNIWSYTYTSNNVEYCASGSYVNICSAPDDTTVAFNYTYCASVQAYSAGGSLYCMWSSTDASYTYVTVYNTDTTTDESTTYRFTCYVMAVSGSNLNATQYPGECISSQTATTVSSPGATLVLTTVEECREKQTTIVWKRSKRSLHLQPPYDNSTDVISMASAVGIAIGCIILLLILGCAVLIWYYNKKRKEKAEKAKLPAKIDPANKKLKNGALFNNGRPRDSKTPKFMNGDVRLNIDTDPDIRRENSINFSMASRGGSGMEGLDGIKKIGPAPVEEPDKVNVFADDTIAEYDNELTLASTFLPMTADENNTLNFTDKEIQEIEKLAAAAEGEDDDDEFDMDQIDDELGLPRLSRAFTPVPPDLSTLPTITYRRPDNAGDSSEDEKTAGGVKKVKLKKNRHKKKIRVSSSKARPKSSVSFRREPPETPFLERLKKQDLEEVENSKKDELEKQMKEIENEVLKARVAKSSERATTGSKYLVDAKRDQKLRPTTKGAGSAAEGERRRFGDLPAENTRKNRKKTPRLRHPMEIQADSEDCQEQGDALQKADEFWREAKRARSGRRREHPEAVTIPSVKEDPFDYRDSRPNTTATSTFSQARGSKSAFGVRPERENSAFIEPQKENKATDNLWERASTLWNNSRSQPMWNNLAHH